MYKHDLSLLENNYLSLKSEVNDKQSIMVQREHELQQQIKKL